MKCPKCGKIFNEPPAMSRVDNSPICSLCGSKEALEVAAKFGAISNEDVDVILEKISQLESK